MEGKKLISKIELIKIANNMAKECDDYIDGITVTDIKTSGEAFVFSGEYFLKEDGTPSDKTLAVFNVFKSLNMTLSKQYKLNDE